MSEFIFLKSFVFVLCLIGFVGMQVWLFQSSSSSVGFSSSRNHRNPNAYENDDAEYKTTSRKFNHVQSLRKPVLSNSNHHHDGIDIFIGGYPKCGTTSLLKIMGEHPEINMLSYEKQACQRRARLGGKSLPSFTCRTEVKGMLGHCASLDFILISAPVGGRRTFRSGSSASWSEEFGLSSDLGVGVPSSSVCSLPLPNMALKSGLIFM